MNNHTWVNMTVDEGANPNLVRVWNHAARRRPDQVLLALAEFANQQGVALVHPDRLRRLAHLATPADLHTRLDRVRACGDVYDRPPHEAPWLCLVAAGLSGEDIVQPLTDADTFAQPPDGADAIALMLLDCQEQARQTFARRTVPGTP